MPINPQPEKPTGTEPDAEASTEVDRAYRAVQAGDADAFAAWLRLVELPLRASLRSFATVVDVEATLQEGLLRMWTLAPTLELTGSNASLRYSIRLVRNLALEEARRLRRQITVEMERLAALAAEQIVPATPPDPGLRRLIEQCIELLPRRPREALRARIIEGGVRHDRDLAAELHMKLNTFLQNIVRARRLMRTCLERHGIAPEELTP